MVRSRIVECILQRQTSQRKRGLPLEWDEDLARLAGDRSLSTDHKVRVGVHQGNNTCPRRKGLRLMDLTPRLAADPPRVVQGVPPVDGEHAGGGQEGVPSPG